MQNWKNGKFENQSFEKSKIRFGKHHTWKFETLKNTKSGKAKNRQLTWKIVHLKSLQVDKSIILKTQF